MNDKTNLGKDLAIASIITIIAGIAGFGFFTPIALLFPVSGIVVGVKYGHKYSLVPHIAAAVVFLLIFGIKSAPLVAFLAGVSFISSKSINRREVISERLVKSTAYMIVFIIAVLLIAKFAFGFDYIEETVQNNMTIIDNYIDEVQKMGIDYNKEQIEEIQRLQPQIANIIKMNTPSILLITSFGISAVSNGIASYIIRRRNIKILAPMKLSRFRVSMKFSVAALVIFIISFIIKFINAEYYNVVVSNLTLIFYFVLLLQGLGVISYALERLRVPKFIRVAILIISIFSVFMTAVISIIGAIDLVFNFRKIREL